MAAYDRGLSSSDIDEMDIGDIIDYIITYNNLNETEEDEIPTRQATQEDWDKL